MKVGIVILAAIFVLGAEAGRKNGRRRIRCLWVKCEAHCRKVRDENGCYMCECEPLCAPLKCEAGCVVQETFDGPCPGCECKKEEVTEVKKLFCSPPKCESGCYVQEVYDGPCPGCECKKIDEVKPVCSVPKCEPGCYVQEVYDGPCPGCKCKKIDEDKDVNPACGITECDSHCKVQTVYEGTCPKCECRSDHGEVYIKDVDAICPPLKCPPNCNIEINFSKGPCRFCNCKTYKNNCKLVPNVRRKKNEINRGEFLVFGFGDGNPIIQCYNPPECPPGNKVDAIFDGPCPIFKVSKESERQEKRMMCIVAM